MGREASGTLARGDGSDAVQRLDLRCAEAICGGVADRQSVDDESDRGGQKEERPAGRAQDRRPGALQSATGLLRGPGGAARIAAAAAIAGYGGGARGADENQDARSVDGSGGRVQQATTAREEVFQRVDGAVG